MRLYLLLALLCWTTLPCLGESAKSLIARAEVLEKSGDTAGALALYLEAEAQLPGDVTLLVRIAKQYGESMVGLESKSEKKRRGFLAIEYAKRAVALAPKNAEAHLALAVCLGRVVNLVSNKTKVEYSRIVRDEVQLATELDPSLDLAWHVLGRWHQGVCTVNGVLRALIRVIYGGLPEASLEEAAECFEKAVKLRPNRLCHVIELGRTYALLGKYEEARKLLERGFAMPDLEPDDPATRARGRATMEAIKGK